MFEPWSGPSLADSDFRAIPAIQLVCYGLFNQPSNFIQRGSRGGAVRLWSSDFRRWLGIGIVTLAGEHPKLLGKIIPLVWSSIKCRSFGGYTYTSNIIKLVKQRGCKIYILQFGGLKPRMFIRASCVSFFLWGQRQYRKPLSRCRTAMENCHGNNVWMCIPLSKRLWIHI